MMLRTFIVAVHDIMLRVEAYDASLSVATSDVVLKLIINYVILMVGDCDVTGLQLMI